jgi:hypothetical protein
MAASSRSPVTASSREVEVSGGIEHKIGRLLSLGVGEQG